MEILDCSGRSFALMGASFAVSRSSMLPGKRFPEPSKIAFLDVGSLRIGAPHRPNEPSRSEPSQSDPSQAVPSRAEPIRAEPTGREPTGRQRPGILYPNT